MEDDRAPYIFVSILINIFQFLDAINETNPRVIDDNRARKLASELKRCSYYETCATYGLNVDRVFQDGKLSTQSLLKITITNRKILFSTHKITRLIRILFEPIHILSLCFKSRESNN